MPLAEKLARHSHWRLRLGQYLRKLLSRVVIHKAVLILSQPETLSDTLFHSGDRAQYTIRAPSPAEPGLAYTFKSRYTVGVLEPDH
jgi:hypothetical protein